MMFLLQLHEIISVALKKAEKYAPRNHHFLSKWNEVGIMRGDFGKLILESKSYYSAFMHRCVVIEREGCACDEWCPEGSR